MIWQDIVLTIANLIFSYALIVQVYTGFKIRKGLMNIQTALSTTMALYAITIVYFSLGLYFSTIIGAINGTLWLILFIQKLKYKEY